MDIELIKKKIKKYKVVSFDIFDTLMKRDVLNPTDVFQIVQQEFDKRYNTNSDFKRLRIEAEKRARAKSKYPEITFDEIYDELDIQKKQMFKSMELETESKVLHQNHKLKNIYDICVKSDKDIYIISDMYLPVDFLEKLLKREGYKNYKALILSADYRKTKRSGELYKILLELSGIENDKLIHIGDSRYADYIGARKCGIKAIHINRAAKNTLYMKKPEKNDSFGSRSFFAFVNSRVSKYKKREEKLGYEVLGPILYSYCQWIHEQYEQYRKNNSSDNTVLWFAARDMYLFKQAYDIIFEGESEAQYIYISRKSLRPILTSVTGDIAESGRAFARGKYTLRSIVEKMGYSVEDLNEGSIVDDRRYDIRSLSEYDEVRRALSSTTILKNEHRLAEVGIEYLRTHGLFNSDVVLADVGWHGTTQYLLRKIQKSVTNKGSVYGLYLGCLDSTNARIGRYNYASFVFNENRSSDFSKGILLFESLILAPHGSTIKYVRKQNEVVPELGEPDNISEFLTGVQKGAIEFVSDFKDNILKDNIELTAAMATRSFCNLAMNPSREELETIGNLDYDDFGVSKVAAPKSIFVYATRPKLLYHDLKYSPWRIGFLYKLFKVKLPYAKLYSYTRNKQGKQT